MINISYVVATLNCADNVHVMQETARTLSENDCKIFVADGGSTDGSLEMLSTIENVEIVCSELDNGIYDAWNRALERVPDGYVGFIGVDDRPLQEFIQFARQAIHNSIIPPKIIYGDRILKRGARVRYLKSPDMPALFFSKRPWFDIPHQGCLHSTDLFRGARFDDRLQLAADFKFLLQHARSMEKSAILYIPAAQVVAEDAGVSRSPKSYGVYRHEYQMIEEELGVKIKYSKLKSRMMSALVAIPGMWSSLKWVSWFVRGAKGPNDAFMDTK